PIGKCQAELGAEEEVVAAVKDRIIAGRLLPHEDRPNLGEGARIFKKERVGQGRDKSIELVIALEDRLAGARLENRTQGGGDVFEPLLGVIPAMAEKAVALGFLAHYAAIVRFFPANETAARKRWHPSSGWRRRGGRRHRGDIRTLASNDRAGMAQCGL